MIQKIREAAKFVAALVGALATAGTVLIPADWAPWLGLVLAIATAVSVYQIPNAGTDATGFRNAVNE